MYTRRRCFCPAATAVVHTIHSPYYYDCLFLLKKRKNKNHKRAAKLGTDPFGARTGEGDPDDASAANVLTWKLTPSGPRRVGLRCDADRTDDLLAFAGLTQPCVRDAVVRSKHAESARLAKGCA